MPKKLLVIIGVTGNQGGSVAARFLQDPNYRIRGLTRNPASPTAKALSTRGVEIVHADLDDRESLIRAFSGANLIFSVTNYWEPFFRPDSRRRAASAGISCRRYAYNVELRQGKNIADAAARTVDSLDDNGFIASTLSHAKKCSGGKLNELYHFDAKADVFPRYVRDKYPRLARKMSCVQTGFFMSSWKLVTELWFGKLPDGTIQMRFPTSPDAPIPHLDVNADTGNFVYAISQLPPGRSYIAAGSTCSWTEYMRLWSKITRVPSSYRQVSPEAMIDELPDKEYARELADMFLYSSDPGYDGGDGSLLGVDEIREAGIDCPTTSLEEWMRKQDWSPVIGRRERKQSVARC
ncbi:hypothetical protein DTO164E3_8600 [Paecilomyces variotii]|uniref:NmrA-like domain-containing protein n=1 Tax=Byssochlamys spectabilis TaxID=264951 RepID=A0A443I7J8_BYSSP|nr:hypothetical protein C8Q69DRAFT_453174 [Paecilomyces variotii]KAJ9191950.1 hypothetical protein DTO164E3_8600 [Paecilomyces variotii]KAJ9196226.1 hypothetical protein DTO032I3_6484 [Paecilomyces variotii]KAJ9223919.1 hypothetical protein DTO169C6_3789 [Paecilomyces variotii]KAJ9229325.1 hypothetical protein DTO169E5_8903 [Paecilomyces variotii]KAJ9254208.1 hypothetical protein DTO207G8_3785 [Paecilomyces variotii]